MHETIDPKTIVYIDESGFDASLHREYARAYRGTPVVTDVKGRHAERLSMIAGLLGKKIVAPLVFDGYTDTTVFNQWITECLLPVLPPGFTVVMDNASFHKHRSTQELIENAGCQLLFLPPYSPDFNPIEQYWGTLKTVLKKILPESNSLIHAIETVFQCNMI